jgi:hypothetical protein
MGLQVTPGKANQCQSGPVEGQPGSAHSPLNAGLQAGKDQVVKSMLVTKRASMKRAVREVKITLSVRLIIHENEAEIHSHPLKGVNFNELPV